MRIFIDVGKRLCILFNTTCICSMYILNTMVCARKLISSFFPLCSAFVYQGYDKANIGPLVSGYLPKYLPNPKQTNKRTSLNFSYTNFGDFGPMCFLSLSVRFYIIHYYAIHKDVIDVSVRRIDINK